MAHFHWVDKILEFWFTGWAMVATLWAIAHPVNMLAEGLREPITGNYLN